MKFGERPVDDISISAIGATLATVGIKCADCGKSLKTVQELWVQDTGPYGIICETCERNQRQP